MWEKIGDILIYIFLGILQGISEVLPISSSGHLALAQSVLNVNADNEALFAIFLHFASLLALLIFFRKLIWQMIVGSYLYIFKKDQTKKDDFMLVVYVIVASIPVGIVGVLFEEEINSIFSNLLYIGIFFLITALILYLISFLKAEGNDKITFKSAIIVGLFQLLGIFPGISRSGITMSGGKVAKLSNDKAKQFAFLLFIPVAFGSFVFSLGDFAAISQAGGSTIILYIISMIFTFIFTYLALEFIFKKFSIKHYKYFAIYMVFIGVLTISYYVIFVK